MKEIMFINYGSDYNDHTRIIVPTEKADAKYDKIKSTLQKGGYISLNKTVVSISDTVEQGECVRYDNI